MATISVGGQTYDKAIDPAGYDKAISNLVSDRWNIPQSQQVSTPPPSTPAPSSGSYNPFPTSFAMPAGSAPASKPSTPAPAMPPFYTPPAPPSGPFAPSPLLNKPPQTGAAIPNVQQDKQQTKQTTQQTTATPMYSVPSTNVPPASNWGTTPQQAQKSAAEQAQARIDQLLAAGKNAWQTGITGANNARDYTNKITQDNRVLRNEQLLRSNSPFSGQMDYLKNNVTRNDTIADTATNADYNNKVGAINQTWADLQAAAPEQQQALYDKLYQQAADLGIRADQLNLQTQNQQFNQGMEQTKFNYGQQQDAIKNDQIVKQDALKLRQEHIKEAQDLSDKYGITVNPTDDYQLMLDQVKGLPTAAQQTAEQKAKTQQQTDAWKAVEMMGEVPPQYADILGIPAGTQTQKAKDQAMARAVQERQVGVSERNATTAEKNATTNANKQPAQPKTDTASQHITNLNKLYTNKDKDTGQTVVTSPQKLENAILGLQLSDEETAKLYHYYGLKIPQ